MPKITESRARWKRGMAGGGEWASEGGLKGKRHIGQPENPPLPKIAI